MTGGKIVRVSEQAYRRLKFLAARRNRSMGQTVEELVAEASFTTNDPDQAG